MIPMNTLAIGHHRSVSEKAHTTCGVCGTEVFTYPGPEVTCASWTCQKERQRQVREREKDRHLAELGEKLPRILKSRGMGPRELRATREQVTPQIWTLCESLVAELMGQPEHPHGGFGLIGKPGTGKTGLMAFIVKYWARQAAEASIRAWAVNVPAKWAPLWANWEAKLSELRMVRRDGGRYADLMDELKEAPLLVIEDLGAERATEDAWGDEQLYEVLEARNSGDRAILWTSNLSKEGLRTRYAGATVSRLIGMAPALEVPTGVEDRRFAQARARLGRSRDPRESRLCCADTFSTRAKNLDGIA